MAVGFAIDNSMTDHGGIIKATQMRASQMGNLFLVADDGHFCPKCKCWSKIIKSHDHVIFDGKAVAYVGDKLTCGAKILPKQSHVVGTSQGENYRSSLSFSSTTQPINNFISNNSKDEHGLKFQLVDKDTQLPIPESFYLLITKEGQEISGFTDDSGHTDTVNTGDNSEDVDLHVFDFSKPMDKWE